MTVGREPIPPGRVSTIRGRWQGPALTWVTRVVLVLAVLGGLLGGPVGHPIAIVAVAIVVATPVARVVWLIGRWHHEGDTRFVVAGMALLATVATGGVLAALGVG
jgi:hypothetical protein